MLNAVGISASLLRKAVGAAYRLDFAIFGRPFEHFFEAVEREVCGSCSSTLDVGCGEESPISRFRERLAYTVGVDAYEPALEKSRNLRIHDETVRGNLLELSDRFPERSFDCVIALEVIEHFTKEDGLRLLKAMERIARKKVVVSTPNGFLPQEAIGGNPLQRHQSGWEVEEMRNLGYRVLGMSGWKPLRGAEAKPAWRPYFLCERLSRLIDRFLERHPQHAFQLLCTKDVA